MNTEEVNLRLYNKMSAEFEKFKEELLNSPPQEVLDRAYKEALANVLKPYLGEE